MMILLTFNFKIPKIVLYLYYTVIMILYHKDLTMAISLYNFKLQWYLLKFCIFNLIIILTF